MKLKRKKLENKRSNLPLRKKRRKRTFYYNKRKKPKKNKATGKSGTGPQNRSRIS